MTTTVKSVPGPAAKQKQSDAIQKDIDWFLRRGGKIDVRETVTSHEPPKGAWRGNNNNVFA